MHNQMRQSCTSVALYPVKLVGWDIAITSNDKIEFIEGNHNPDLHMMQEPDQIGKKHLFQKYIDELENGGKMKPSQAI